MSATIEQLTPVAAVENAITAAMKACMHDEAPLSGLTDVLVKLRQARNALDKYVARKKR